MERFKVNQIVQLVHGLGALYLDRGALGVVRSIWFAESPAPLYEVEFKPPREGDSVRSLFWSEDIRPVAEACTECQFGSA